MAQTYNFAPITEENGPLAKYEIGETVHKTVRIMSCIYTGNQGFGVYEVDENDRRFTIIGSFPYQLSMNAFYRITGQVVLDKRGLRQIKISDCESTFPTTEQGIITVLQTLHGLDTQAYKLYSIVGPDVLTILQNEPRKIVSMVKGVGIKRAKTWQEELLSRGAHDKQLRKLYEFGLNQRQATSLVAEYGFAVCDEVASNPYFLMGKINGFSFKKCDKFALDSGIDVRHPERLRSGLLYTLSAIENKGHCTYPYDEFMKDAHQLLDVFLNQKMATQLVKSSHVSDRLTVKWGSKEYVVPTNAVRDELHEWHTMPHNKTDKFVYYLDYIDSSYMETALRDLQTGDHLIVEEFDGEKYVTPGSYYRAETQIAADIRDLAASERVPFDDVDSVINNVLAQQNITLEQKQMEAVSRICNAEGGVFILNGSAGCGKTFTLNIIIRVLKQLYKTQRKGIELDPCILAPTGKAAKVAAKSTGLFAQTIHKAMGLVSVDNSQSSITSNATVMNNCVVVDEFSMVDEILCAQLLSGIPKTAKVIFLGDTEQLPSIRAGRVLKDLIESGKVPVLTLDVVKRQDADSGILQNANKIIRGESINTAIVNKETMNGNAYVYDCSDPIKAQSNIIRMAKKCGLQQFQTGDVQVLCPLKAGPVGTDELNWRLQQELNPGGLEREIVVGTNYFKQIDGSQITTPASFRVGDCVIHTKNNYDQPWFIKHPVNGFIETSKAGVVNGDTGIVAAISAYKDGSNVTHRVLYVQYGDHYIAYDNDYEELALAYALTIHKSQGSQWPMVICPLVQHTFLLNRKLLYTMYTRAASTNILIGSRCLIDMAIGNNREDGRRTLLKERLAKKI